MEKRVVELLYDALPYRQIANQTGVSVGTVRAVAARNNVDTSDRVAHVEQAATMNKARGAERRNALIERLYAQADRLMDQMDQPTLVYSFGGKENTYNEHTITEPTFADKRNIMQSVGIALQRANDLELRNSEGDSIENARGLIHRLVVGIEASVQAAPDYDPDQPSAGEGVC